MAQWIPLGGQGPAGPAGSSGSGAPAAPNVTAATTTVSFAPFANAQKIIFAGSFTLPTSDPNYNQDQTVTITAVDPFGNQFQVATFTGTPVGSPTSYTNINGAVIQAPVSTMTGWELVFTCFNQDGVPTPGAYTISSITITPSGVTAISGTEVGPEYVGTDGALRTVISITPTCSTLPLVVTLWIDFDDGNGPLWVGWQTFTSSGQSVEYGQPTAANNQEGSIFIPVVPGQNNWTVWGFADAINSSGAGLHVPAYNPSTTYGPGGVVFYSGVLYVSIQTTSGNTPSSSPAYWAPGTSGTFTVALAQAALATDCTNIQFLNDPNVSYSPATMDYAVGSNGQIVWIFYCLQFNMPTTAIDPFFWFAQWTIQLGFLSNGICTISGGTTLTDSTGPFTSNQVNYVMHVNGVWVLGTYSSATVMTLSSPLTNGASQPYDIWNPAPVNAVNGNQGTNDDPDLLFYGRVVVETPPIIDAPVVFTDYGAIYPGFTYPPETLPNGGGTNPYRTFKTEVYAVSILAQNTAGGTQGDTYTRQTGWPAVSSGGTDAGYLTPVSPNPNTLNLATSDPSSIGGPLAVSGGKLFVPNNAITNTYLAAASVEAANLAADAISVSNATTVVQALALVDSLVATVGINKLQASTLTQGTAIFTGTVILSQGSGNPIMVLAQGGPTGIFLYSEAVSGGGSGLTSAPYVAIEASGIGVYSGANPSVTITSSSITLWSVNGSTSGPYTQVSSAGLVMLYSSTVYMEINSSGLEIINGSYSTTVGSSSIALTNGTSSVTLNSSGVQILNGGYSVTVLSTGITISYTTYLLTITSTSGVSFSNTSNSLVATYTAGGFTITLGSTFTVILGEIAGTGLLLINQGGSSASITANGFGDLGTGTAYNGTLAGAAGKNVVGGVIQN